MADHTHIEWTDATWNPITGCTLVSAGCTNCYAARLAATRLRNHPSRAGLARLNAAGVAKFTGEVRFNEQWLYQPLRWRRPRRVFVCAHGDLFHEDVPGAWIDRVFAVMALAPQHTFQILTKRPERMRAYLSDDAARDRIDSIIDEIAFDLSAALDRRTDDLRSIAPDLDETWPLPNVWLGTSAEDQATADARIPYLLATPAAVRFVSAEPLLGPLDLTDLTIRISPGEAPSGLAGVDALTGVHWDAEDTIPGIYGNPDPRLDWVIAGGESGPGARPMHPDWARDLRDQCAEAGVDFHFKQWGEWAPEDAIAFSDDEVRYETLMTVPFGEFHDGADWIDSCSCSEGDDGAALSRVGKSRAGRRLDGVDHNAMPEVPHA